LIDRDGSALLRALPALLVVALATLVPLAYLVIAAPDSVEGWTGLLQDEPYASRIPFTLLQSTLAVALGLAVGLLVSWLLAHQRGFPRALMGTLLLVPIALPGVSMALAVRALAAENFVPGVLIVGAHATFVLAVTTWLMTPAWSAVPRRSTEAARLLGASRMSALRALNWPALRPPLFLAAALGFVHGVAAVATVLILGEPSQWTLEATLLVRGGDRLAPILAAAALVQTVVVAVLLLVHPGWPSLASRPLPASRLARAVGGVTVAAVVVVALLPVFALAREAVTVEGELALSPLTGLRDDFVGGHGTLELMRWSLTYALVAAVGATFFAWLSGRLVAASDRSRRLRAVVVLAVFPLLLTPLALALGVREVAEALGVDLEATWAVMAAVHGVLAYPLAVRILAIPRRAEMARLREAAVLLGQSPRRARWRWERTRTLRALFASFLMCAALTLGEAGAASLIAPARAVPSAPAILDAARAGNGGAEVAALATVLAGIAVIAFVLGERLRPAQSAGQRVEGR
jgi:thiamine transport system permease protein